MLTRNHHSQKAFQATDQTHLDALGLSHDVAPWEDGLRTDPSAKGTYEWWYFDAHLDNGAKLVITFFAKQMTDTHGGLAPRIAIDLDLPDGSRVNKLVDFDPTEFTASTTDCDVRIGANTFTGDLHDYTIHLDLDDQDVEVALHSTTMPWRPGTGYTYYGDDEGKNFAWLPSVPQGKATVTYTVGESSPVTTTGHGYHDHNWGNVALPEVVDNWYWGRATVGDYTFITSDIIAAKPYGYAEIPVFLLARGGQVVADDAAKVEFWKADVSVDEETGKPVADRHGYIFTDGADRYEITYTRDQTILREHLIDSTHGLKRVAAHLIGFDGAYLRFSGTVELRILHDGIETLKMEGPAIWELMYFGHTRHKA